MAQIRIVNWFFLILLPSLALYLVSLPANSATKAPPADSAFEQLKSFVETVKDQPASLLGQNLKSIEASQLRKDRSQSLTAWQTQVSFGRLENKKDSLTTSTPVSEKSWLGSASLSKAFSTGTLTELKVSNLDQTLNSGLADSQNFNQEVSLSLTQPLWPPYERQKFQLQWRGKTLEAQRELFSSALAVQEAEQKTWSALWQVLLAQEQIRVSLKSLERSQRLSTYSERRQKFGLSSAGESAQAKADLEVKKQNLQLDELNYAEALRNLKEITGGLEPPSLKNWPKAEEVLKETLVLPRPEDTIAFNLLSLSQQSARLAKDTARQAADSELNLRLQLKSFGLEPTASAATDELTSTKKNEASAYLVWSKSFGSAAIQNEVKAAEATLLSAEASQSTLKQRLQQTQTSLLERAQLLRLQVKSLQTQVTLRSQALNALLKSYDQGRTDVSILIDADGKLDQAELQIAKTIVDWHINSLKIPLSLSSLNQ